MHPKPLDVVLLGTEWPERALLRAQLIEAGYEVVAIDRWPMPTAFLDPGMKPRVCLIDLHGLPNPRETLDGVRVVMSVERVLVVAALGTLPAEEVRRLGFAVVERPVTIGQIVEATGALLSRTPPQQSFRPSSPTRRQ
jgi:hypothetical protein